MKNKKMTYLLIAGAIVVWGLIFYRILMQVGSDDIPIAKKTFVKSFDDHIFEKPDTFSLIANYRDPFLGAVAKPRINTDGSLKPSPSAKPSIVVEKKVAELPFDWSIIKFHGTILNSKTGKRVAFVTLKGRELMLSDGENYEGLTILKNLNDSLQIQYQGKNTFIKRN
jgi:hypothetical protein